MSSREPSPAQRLAISRARLADALRDPVWMVLLHRWLQTQAAPLHKLATRYDGPDRPW